MTNQIDTQGPASSEPHEPKPAVPIGAPGSTPAKSSKFWLKVKTALGGFLLICISLIAGIEAGIVQYWIHKLAYQLNASWVNQSSGASILGVTSILTGASIFLLVALLIFTPVVWRRVRGIGSQRAVVYSTVQIFGIAIGLLGLNSWVSFFLTTTIVFAGTRIWWHWERNWRGVGRSPSFRSGLVRPTIHSGQVWFAFVRGEKETKNRPIVVLHSTEGGRWLVAYCTSRPPRYEAQKKYFLEIPMGIMRGIEKDSWVNISDIRSLKRNQLRAYIGLAPRTIYEQVCAAASLNPDSDAWTINEANAGENFGPIESEIRRVLGLSYDDGESNRTNESIFSIIKGAVSWLSKKDKN